MPKTTSTTPLEPSDYQKMAAIAEAKGFKQAPADHPVYSEGPSITFLSHTPAPSPVKATASTPTDSQTPTD